MNLHHSMFLPTPDYSYIHRNLWEIIEILPSEPKGKMLVSSVYFMLRRLKYRGQRRLGCHLDNWMFEVRSMLNNIYYFILLFHTGMVWFIPPENKGKWSFVDISEQYPCKWWKLGIYKSSKEIKDQAPHQWCKWAECCLKSSI